MAPAAMGSWKLIVAWDTNDPWLVQDITSQEQGIIRRERIRKSTRRPVKWTAIVKSLSIAGIARTDAGGTVTMVRLHG